MQDNIKIDECLINIISYDGDSETNESIPVVKFLNTERVVHIHNVASEKDHNPESGKHRPLLLKIHPITMRHV